MYHPRIRIRKRTWVVCRTEPRRESWAAENVRRQGLTYYLPYYHDQHESKVLLFPGYLFVQPRARQWIHLTSTYGMIGVITVGSEPAWLEDKVVDALRAREDKNGAVALPNQLKHEFAKGQKVKLRSGPFLGYIGIYEGTTRADRERVLLGLLGRATPIEVDTSQIEAVVEATLEETTAIGER